MKEIKELKRIIKEDLCEYLYHVGSKEKALKIIENLKPPENSSSKKDCCPKCGCILFIVVFYLYINQKNVQNVDIAALLKNCKHNQRY